MHRHIFLLHLVVAVTEATANAPPLPPRYPPAGPCTTTEELVPVDFNGATQRYSNLGGLGNGTLPQSDSPRGIYIDMVGQTFGTNHRGTPRAPARHLLAVLVACTAYFRFS